jgi:hypothetical protein
MELPLPSVDEIEKKLKLRDRAATAAQDEAIRSQDTAFDDGQNSVVNEMGNRMAEGRSTAARHLDQYQKRRGAISAELEGLPRQSFPRTVEGAVQLVLRGHDEELKKTQLAEVQSLRALKVYRLRYGINRPARYPEWRVMHWAIILLLFFIESVANSQFFAKASPFGLIGGWLQAAIISATNIGLGLLGGMAVLPWWNRREVSSNSTKAPCALAIIIGFLLLLFNLATAHYRVLLEELPDQAIKLAIGHLWSNPFAIDNFDAWVLLFVGIIFTTVAWIEGYKSDDPLREYGHLDRRYEKARDENAEKKTAIRAEAVSQFMEKKKELVTAARLAKTLFANYSTQIAGSALDADRYCVWRSRIEDATRTLLSRYRDYYLTVNELDPKPAYFNEEYSFPEDTPFIEEEKRIQQAKNQLTDFKEIVNDLETIHDSGVRQENDVISSLEKAVDNFFACMEGVAAKESDEANTSSSVEISHTASATEGNSS